MGKQVYLDYSATTPLAKEVNRAMYEFGKSDKGNPSSPHKFGQNSKIILEETRYLLANVIKCKPNEVIFTSGGTESNNLALIGVTNSLKDKGKHIIVSGIEHASIIETISYLREIGFEITFVNPDRNGRLALSVIENEVRPDTILIAIMYVNNETGIVHPVKDISAFCEQNKIIFLCDAVQAFGKMYFAFDEIKANLMSISAHKIYGPKGIGALIIKEGTPINNILFGGGQESNRRPGTENILGIVGFGEAVRLLGQNQSDETQIEKIQSYFEKELKYILPSIQIIGESVERSSFISCISFPGMDNESLLLNLDLAGIAVSIGSACSSGSIKQSHVLKAMGLQSEIINGAIRFSYGRYTKIDEIDFTIEQLYKITQRLNS